MEIFLRENPYSVWKIDSSSFPKEGNLKEKIEFLLNYGILAPSTHNSQPWLFKVGDNFLEIFADLQRRLREGDKEGRMVFITLGCAIKNIKTAADYFSLNYQTEYNTELNNYRKEIFSQEKPLLAARIVFKESLNHLEPAQETMKLFGAVTKRRSNRNEYKDNVPSQEFLGTLKNLNREPDLRVDFISDKDKKEEIANISSWAMGKVMSGRNFRRELAGWIRNNLSKKSDGMPGATHQMSFIISLLAPYILRNIDVSKVEAEKERKRILNLPAVGIISSEKNNPYSWIRVGELLEHILLKISAEGLNSVIRVASIEVPEAREKLKDALKLADFSPQMFFGLGWSKKEAPLSPRRRVEEVTIK